MDLKGERSIMVSEDAGGNARAARRRLLIEAIRLDDHVAPVARALNHELR
jgi:hypothetical protein